MNSRRRRFFVSWRTTLTYSEATFPTDARSAAAVYLDHGLALVPLPPRSKDPGFDDWPRFRLDPADLDRHFPEGVERNIAVLNGSPSGNLADADLDCEEALRAAAKLLPATTWIFGRASTPRSHYLYRTDAPFASASRKFSDPLVRGDRATLCELRGTGGISVIPPGSHKETGEAIRWDTFQGDPATVALETLSERVTDIAVVALLGRYWPAKGGRDDAYKALAGGLLRGLDVVRAERLIDALAFVTDDEEAAARVKKPEAVAARLATEEPTVGWPTLARILGDRGEIIVAQVRRWLRLDTHTPQATKGPPENWPDPLPLGRDVEVPPFPLELLPPAAGDWARCLAEQTQTPPDLPALVALPVCGAGVARRFEVQIRDGWREPTNLFAAVALPPSDRKSAVFTSSIAPLVDLESADAVRLGPVRLEQESERRQLEGRLRSLEGKIARLSRGEAGDLREQAKEVARELAAHVVTAPPKYFCDDATAETVAKMLAEQGGRLLQAAAEGTLFDIARGRYSEGGKGNFDVYLKGHAGDPLRVHRIGRDGDVIDRPALSVAVVVQPDVIRGLHENPSFKTRGFLARFLYSVPVSRVGSRQIAARAVPATVREAWRSLVTGLWRLQEGEDGPTVLHLSTEAERLMREFEAWLEPRLKEGEELSALGGWAGKLAGACARIAGIFHLIDRYKGGWDTAVGPAAVEAAIRLGRDYLLPHAQAAFALMGSDGRAREARRVWAAIVRHLGSSESSESSERRVGGAPRISRRAIHQGVRGRKTFAQAEEVDPCIDYLVDRYYLVPVDRQARRGGGTAARNTGSTPGR